MLCLGVFLRLMGMKWTLPGGYMAKIRAFGLIIFFGLLRETDQEADCIGLFSVYTVLFGRASNHVWA